MRYRFVNRGGWFGPEEIEQKWGKLGTQMIALIGEDEGAVTPRAFCEHWAAELGDTPETVGFESYDVFVDDETEPRYTLIYMGWCDAGWLFYQRTARDTGWSLWPEGFRPSERTGAVTDPGLDGDALSQGFRTAS